MSEPPTADYQRADFGPLAATKYGIGFHWTTWTAPQTGEPLPFEAAVDAFDVDAFVAQAVECGAGHVLFTATHARHHLPCPNPEVDLILPGRTCQRDLLLELADGLAAEGILFLVYYNHGLHGGDPEWHEAVGYKDPDHRKYFDTCNRILGWLGERYGQKITAFWFDHGLNSFGDTPWLEMTRGAKAGNPNRLICYNTGIEQHKCLTPYQDYWAGEVCRLSYFPIGPVTPAGFPWYSFVSWHVAPDKPMCGEWGISMQHQQTPYPQACADCATAYVERFLAVGGAVTFNLLCYQDGSAYPPDLAVMRELKQRLR